MYNYAKGGGPLLGWFPIQVTSNFTKEEEEEDVGRQCLFYTEKPNLYTKPTVSIKDMLYQWKKKVFREPGFAIWQTRFSLKRNILFCEKGKRKVQGVSQSQTAAFPRPQEEEETDKSKQAQTEQTYEKH